MEVDAGFDMVPPLSKEAEDARNWGKVSKSGEVPFTTPNSC